ncbi:hypothetical protein PWT90_03715 [Aphanocladium album]|nr:hypothetical protein PWT90_03715 [Aphanocladium album]
MKSGVVDQLTRRIEGLEHKLYEDDIPNGRPPSSSPAFQLVAGDAASNNADTLKTGADLRDLSTQLQSLGSSIGSLVAAMQPVGDTGSCCAERARKRPKLGPGYLAEERVPEDSSTGHSNSHAKDNPFQILEGRVLQLLVDEFFHQASPTEALQSSSTPSIFSDEELVETTEYAMTKVILASSTTVSIESLQSRTIVAFTLLINGEHSKAWPMIGSLTRSMESLQLGVEEREQEAQTALLSPSLLPASEDWVEEEERRRVFWNVFILDRICSATAGYRIALTGDNVWRRLPLCGTLWNTESFAVSPYLGIWDRSAGKTDSLSTFLPQHYPSPEQPTTVNTDSPDGVHMGTVGAFAYYIEALEWLCRVDVYFLRQKVDLGNRDELSKWLTRFQELDMRLVHWKLSLPSKWKDPEVPPQETGRLDPNMTLAHITHNTSTILLHQRIGYPEEQLKNTKLPTFLSAETCRQASGEIATIARKYLASSSERMPLSPQFCFCLCISGRALLVHWQRYGPQLDPNFWVLIAALDEAARRSHSSSERPSLASLFADQLRQLHSKAKGDPSSKLFVLGSFGDSHGHSTIHGQTVATNRSSQRMAHASTGCFSKSTNIGDTDCLKFPLATSSMCEAAKDRGGLEPAAGEASSSNFLGSPPLMDCGALTGDDNLSSILDALGDTEFLNMDRVILFSDLDSV